MAIGDKFGRWTVIGEPFTEDRGSYKRKIVECRCECGVEKNVSTCDLKQGKSVSCGCYNREMSSIKGRTHGMVGTRTYKSWQEMKSRCDNPRKPEYFRYGGAGITVCDRWLQSFENFLEDMVERPEGASLDRIDPRGNYEPSNCRWADRTVQVYNTKLGNNNKSGKRGVWYDKKRGDYQVRISKNRKIINLGRVATFEEAVKIREEAEMK